ncbi:hypothetical protein E2320_013655, partial [Naja naja]
MCSAPVSCSAVMPIPARWQSYGPEHLLTFHNLKHLGLLTEQVSGETLAAMENKVSKLVTDKAAGKGLWDSIVPWLLLGRDKEMGIFSLQEPFPLPPPLPTPREALGCLQFTGQEEQFPSYKQEAGS